MTRYARLKRDTHFTESVLVPKETIVKVDDWKYYVSTSMECNFRCKILGHKLESNGLYSTVTFEKADEYLEFLDD